MLIALVALVTAACGSSTDAVGNSRETLTAIQRINAGGDAVGSFTADAQFFGGSPFFAAATISNVASDVPPSVYQSERYGNFEYRLSGLTAGATYTIRLHFAEIYWTEVGRRVFNVDINGSSALSNFDIFAAAGANRALVRDFSAVADASGQVVVRYTTLVDNAKASAIEVLSGAAVNQPPAVAAQASVSANVVAGSSANLHVLGADDGGEPSLTYTWEVLGQAPGAVTFAANGTNASKDVTATFSSAGSYNLKSTIRDSAGLSTTSTVTVVVQAAPSQPTAPAEEPPPTSQPAVASYRINCGGDGVSAFTGDNNFTGGTRYNTGASVSTSGVSNAAPAAVYQTERYGNFSYALGGLSPNGSYTVRLHFAEIAWTEAGRRLFNVAINGSTVLSSFDIYANYGANKAAVRDFSVRANAGGRVDIQFSTVVDNAKCSAIEVLSAAASSPPTVVNPATASPSSVQDSSTTLSVLGADDGGESQLVYNWSTTGTAPATVVFSSNDSNSAKTTVARFSKAGTYALTATARDSSGQTATSTVSVVVSQALSAIRVSPSTASVAVGATQQFSAGAVDQFGNDMGVPTVTWTVTGGGTISTSGRFTAGGSAGGPFTVTASGSGKSGTGSVSVASSGQAVPDPSDTEVVIGWTSTRQKIEGFGAADPQFADFAKDDGAFTDQMADKLFSTSSGIGLSLLRVGITPNGTNWAAWSNPTKAAARGARVWATPWSAPANMKDNASTTNGGHLLPSSYAAWADQLIEFRRLLKVNSGVDLYALSAQNEPDFSAYYESMLFTNDEMVNFVKVLGPKLAALSPRPKLIVGNYSNWDNLTPLVTSVERDPQALSFVDFYGSNQYYGTPDPETGTRPVWEMEWSTFGGFDGGIQNALEMSRKVHDALTIANVAAWHYWWCRLQWDGTDNQALFGPNDVPTKRLWALGNWSKFVRPGFTRVTTQGGPQNVYVSAFKDPATGKFAVVLVNDSGTPRTLGVSVSGANPGSVVPWRTSSNEDLTQLSSIATSNHRFTATLPATSITTFVGTAN